MTFNLTYPAGMVPLLTDAGVGLLRRREEGGDGRDIQIRSRSSGITETGIIALYPPFTILPGTASGAITIKPGLLNNIMPTLGGDLLNAIPTPEMDAFPSDGLWYIYLSITVHTTSGLPTGVTVLRSLTQPGETDTLAILILGAVTVVDGDVTETSQYRNGSFWYQRCGYETPYAHLFGRA